ncbi:MAG: DUF2169 domain-containing protein [Polyangia bacterium]
MPRKPVRDKYDAVLDFAPSRAVPSVAYVLVKQTYRIGERGCVLDAAQPLVHDLRDDTLQPRLPPGSDFWIQKQATDVVVQGSAFAPNGRPIRSMTASVTVGKAAKRINVFGNRRLEWRSDGTPVIPYPETFIDMPLTYENAYGGIDVRMDMAPPQSPEELVKFDLLDYPGIYPRNLHGKGYLVRPEPIPGALMPNLENPRDLLTADRLFVRDPRLWYRQPFPWCFDWTNAVMFPRMAYLGLSPCFPPPSDVSLPEVAQGILPANFKQAYSPSLDAADSWPAIFYQEASLGMSFTALSAGIPMAVEGMHPERARIAWQLPSPPSIQVLFEGKRVPATIRLTNCVITPADLRMCLVYAAVIAEMPRVFIPGVHKEIPFLAVIDGDRPLAYAPPVPILEQLEGKG